MVTIGTKGNPLIGCLSILVAVVSPLPHNCFSYFCHCFRNVIEEVQTLPLALPEKDRWCTEIYSLLQINKGHETARTIVSVISSVLLIA